MNSAKQQLLIEYLISSPDTFAICKSIIKPEYFNPDLRQVVSFIDSYYESYNTTPNPVLIKAETSINLSIHQITRDQILFCSTEIEKFCKRKALDQAIIKASAIIGTEKESEIEQMIRDAMSISLDKDLGIQYFDDPSLRLERQLLIPDRIPTGWSEVDELMGGGIARTELLLVSANSGGGKSITLGNLSLNLSSQGLHVLYLSLELSEDMIAQRFDTMLSGVSTVNWKSNINTIAQSVEQFACNAGTITIKRMPSGTSCQTIRSYLKEYELKFGYVPDALIVDYLDIMGANERVSADNVSEKDKRTSEQLRDILSDFNMIGATASQQRRDAIDNTELTQAHIAGGITKVNTVDWYISIIMTNTMKAAGEIMFSFLKSRSSDAVGKIVELVWDNSFLRIKNRIRKNNPDEIMTKVSKNQGKRSLSDLLEI
ncbi:MAG: DnaB-like helicase C-terminal domain-containing protein [Nitrososphaeraceae archaeon]